MWSTQELLACLNFLTPPVSPYPDLSREVFRACFSLKQDLLLRPSPCLLPPVACFHCTWKGCFLFLANRRRNRFCVHTQNAPNFLIPFHFFSSGSDVLPERSVSNTIIWTSSLVAPLSCLLYPGSSHAFLQTDGFSPQPAGFGLPSWITSDIFVYGRARNLFLPSCSCFPVFTSRPPASLLVLFRMGSPHGPGFDPFCCVINFHGLFLSYIPMLSFMRVPHLPAILTRFS